VNDDKYNRIVIQFSEPIVFSAHRLVSPWLEVMLIAGMMHMIAARTESADQNSGNLEDRSYPHLQRRFETCILQFSFLIHHGLVRLSCHARRRL